ncbi:MAG: Ig-like domain-containing protein [Verrucomicrobia bacterium]|nr:Ig-like domain-containing protein [Verrucomicrobiota bacterium]
MRSLIGRIWSTSTAVVLIASACYSFTPLPSRTNDSPGFVYTPSPSDWRAVPIYQVMTDRFADGDPFNNDDNPDADVNPFGAISIHGGDFEGVEQKLDYLQMLGARAVWVSPVVKNVNGIFHGYAAQDLNQIDPHWGTLDDLRNLADALHARGMYLIIDVVQNHMGDLIDSTDSGYPNFNINGYNLRWRNSSKQHAPPFDDLARFHNYGSIQNWSDPTQTILGDFSGLDGIKTEDAGVRADLTTIFKALIAATDCDGFRVDTARHIEMGFWEEFLPSIYSYGESIGKSNFIVFAEAWLGSDIEVGTFTATNRFNSALNFPMRNTMEDVFIWNQPTSWLGDRYDGLIDYDPVARDQLVNFIDNHDMARYLTGSKLNNDWNRLKLALTFLYSYPAVPCLYYGTEQGFNGDNDPNDREDMFDGEFEFGPSLGDNFDQTHELFRHVRWLNLLREAYPSLVAGDFDDRWKDYAGSGLYVYSRIQGPEEVIVALNTSSGSKTAYYQGSGPGTTYAQGTVLVNLLNTNESVIVGNGVGPTEITFTMPGRSMKVFVPQSDIRDLRPSVIACMPEHDTNNVALLSDIILDFDTPMNTGSVQSAFSLIPAAAGSFTWANNQTRLTFTPDQALDSNAVYRVTLNAACAATNGLELGAGFSSRFGTGATLENPFPFGDYVMDGVLDAGVPALVTNNGMILYAQYDQSNEVLYVATFDAGEGNDHFILIDDNLSGTPAEIPLWNKTGTVASDGPLVADENDNDFSAWFSVSASAAAKTGPNGGVIEGVISLAEQYDPVPQFIYIAVALYPSQDGGTLLADYQVPWSQNFDQNIDSNEYLRLNLLTGEVIVTPKPSTGGEVELKHYLLDGQLSPVEAAALRAQNGMKLYADFNGELLYVATQDAGEGNDHFIFVTDDPVPDHSAPWGKSGRVKGREHFLADENDSDFEGWFINNAWDGSLSAATPFNNGGYLEGTLDLVDIFGMIPSNLFIAVTPYNTWDGGALLGAYQVPAGDGNADLDSTEYYLLDLTVFDTDMDGIPDLQEDLNANGVMDTGETGARVVDSDGDGQTDGAERITGTDGTDSNSLFEISAEGVSLTMSGGAVQWQSYTGRVYDVLFTEDVLAAPVVWSNLATNIGGSGGILSYEPTNAAAIGYYKIRVKLE